MNGIGGWLLDWTPRKVFITVGVIILAVVFGVLFFHHETGVVADKATTTVCDDRRCEPRYYVQMTNGLEMQVLIPAYWGVLQQGQTISYYSFGLKGEIPLIGLKFRPTMLWVDAILEQSREYYRNR